MAELVNYNKIPDVADGQRSKDINLKIESRPIGVDIVENAGNLPNDGGVYSL